MASSNSAEHEAREKFEKLVRRFHDAVLITSTPEGPHGRPMVIAGVQQGPVLWFFTHFDSGKVGEICGDDRALAVMKRIGKYLCVRGRADVVQDSAAARRFWTENQRIWFKGPMTSPWPWCAFG
jgi:general stress protein 26